MLDMCIPCDLSQKLYHNNDTFSRCDLDLTFDLLLKNVNFGHNSLT